MYYYMCKNSKLLQKKLQVGDKVRIISKERRRSINAQGYNFMFGFNEDMAQYCGKELVITKKETIEDSAYEDGTHPEAFSLKGSGGYIYSVEMFEFQLPLLKNE